MSKFLHRWQRNFNACSDCAHFQKGDPIDERYPEIVYGFCNKHKKAVDNRYETTCEDCTYGHTCEECIHFESTAYYDKAGIYHELNECNERCLDDIDENDEACEDFELNYD